MTHETVVYLLRGKYLPIRKLSQSSTARRILYHAGYQITPILAEG